MLPVLGRYATVVLLVLIWSCAALGFFRPVDSVQMLCTSGAVLLGAAALRWLRPSRVGVTAPQAMLLLGAIGMMLGLMADSPAQLALLASACGLANGDLWSTMQLHWTFLPWMHAGMWIGGFAAIPLLRATRPACKRQYCVRLAQNFACSAWMTVGMSCGVLVVEYLAAQSGARGPASMFGGMFAGMVWGMVASVALYRLCFRVRDSSSYGSSAIHWAASTPKLNKSAAISPGASAMSATDALISLGVKARSG
jgi:hypothetical protein